MHVVFIFLLLLFHIFPKSTFAHAAGYPPFFKVDGQIANPYFVQEAGVLYSEINIPQDIAPKNYLPNEPINFEIDMSKLEPMFTEDVIDKLKFEWNFGDGKKATGIKNTYAYTKPGSYILEILVDYGDPTSQPLLIESILINVLPQKDYMLPTPLITANGKIPSKADYNILDFNLDRELMFDGSGSKGATKLVSYVWDFGDQQVGKGPMVKHQYQLPQAFATVLLRVQDDKGLFADAVVNIRNSGKNDPTIKRSSPLFIGAITIVVGAIIGFLIIIWGNKKT